MKKKILGGIAVLVIAAVTAFNVNLSQKSDMVDVSLANVEALAVENTDTPCSDCMSSLTSICWFSGVDGCIGHRLIPV